MLTDEQFFRHQEAYRSALSKGLSANTPAPRRGEDIFSRPGPRTWDEYIGQDRAKGQLRASICSAKARGTRLEHVLIAAGQYGAGKSALARLIAAEAGVGIVELSGKISMDQARPILKNMQDGDILFIDEIHTMVSSGKAAAEWLLHLLEDGRLLSARGVEVVPDITIVAATTDVGKLPETIISRFPIKPILTGYTLGQAAEMAGGMATDLGFGQDIPVLSARTAVLVAQAANCNGRDMRALLTTLRDAAYGGMAEVDENGDYDMAAPLAWAGLTYDGLSQGAQDYLTVMLMDFDGKAGERTVAAALGEPGPLKHVEKLLLQKGLMAVTPSGRQLTDAGVKRVGEMLEEADRG